MSCYHCLIASKSKQHLIDIILKKGEKLKESMTKTILESEQEQCSSRSCKKCLNNPINSGQSNIIDSDFNKIQAYLRGDEMSREDEDLALQSLRSMSTVDLNKITDMVYTTNSNEEIRNDATFLNNTHVVVERLNLDSIVGDSLRFVDSLRIFVNFMVLNETGNKKVFDSLAIDKISNISQTYFIEYTIPDKLIKKNVRPTSNTIRICARKTYLKAINFNHTSVHDVISFDNFDLIKDIQLKFKISSRGFRQKRANVLGYAFFDFATLNISKNLTCYPELAIILDENNPLVVGKLKVKFQLGCNRLYFGREFVDAIESFRRKQNIQSDNSTNSMIHYVTKENSIIDTNLNRKNSGKDISITNRNKLDEQCDSGRRINNNNIEFRQLNINTATSNVDVDHEKRIVSKEEHFCHTIYDKTVLFGFIYVSEAQFDKEVYNSHINCQLFTLDTARSTNLLGSSSNPVYNFSQEVPLIYDEELLLKLRENFMVIEFYEKFEAYKEVVIGLTKLPLNPFYLAYRNPIIIKYLSERPLPIISIDGWEHIYNFVNNEIVGRVSVLLALGTKEQIDKLVLERGFNKDAVKYKSPPISPRKLIITETREQDCLSKPVKDLSHRDSERSSNSSSNVRKRTSHSPPVKLKNSDRSVRSVPSKSATTSPIRIIKNTEDIGIQANMSDSKETRDIGALLNQLIAQKTRNIHVENSTNTEVSNNDEVPIDKNNEPEIKQTSDLLETLQKALSLEEQDKKSFKVKISINGALHLPGRKKCKARKSKNKNGRHEEILPSTYVTFEYSPGEFKMTPVAPKSTSPKWNYSCDLSLSTDFLTNNQKRLIFKIWRKSTNTTLTPNLQTDFVIGIAAVDLTVLVAGLSNVQGWFNIVDFSNKCNGQINIHVTPQEDLTRFHRNPETNHNITTTTTTTSANHTENSSTQPIQISDEPSELLGRALKRKFTELDEITQRLRLRLSKVTNEESDASNDELADEFERDINTLCVEDDFDMVDFEKEARNFNINHMKEVGLLQQTDCNRGTVEGKQKIDNLLEKLSLLSSVDNRYVSGCSQKRDDGDAFTMMDDLDRSSRPNIHTDTSFYKAMEEKFQWASTSSTNCSESDNSRSGPEGQQHSDDEKERN